MSKRYYFDIFSSSATLLIPGVAARVLIGLNLYKLSWGVISNIIGT